MSNADSAVQDRLRSLPAVQVVLAEPRMVELAERLGHAVVSDAIRQVIDNLRHAILEGETVEIGPDLVAERVESLIVEGSRPQIRRAVNATGIILHTGLGRARMPDPARQAVADVAGYCNIQIALETGGRVRREHTILALAKKLTGAEDVLLVNNNAGATLLVLRALAAGKEVV
ncbi:L-seryl-tRNA(Sec) selenium transferase, partial [Myxococcota bacterium]